MAKRRGGVKRASGVASAALAIGWLFPAY